MTALVIAEWEDKRLKETTLNTLTAANLLNQPVDVLVMGYQVEGIAKELSKIQGVSKVLLADELIYKDILAENAVNLIQKLAHDYTHIFAPATTFGKNLIPRLAAVLNVAAISDVVAIKSLDIFVRPIYAGNAFAEVQSLDDKKLITIRTTAFSASETTSSQATIEILKETITASTKVTFLKKMTQTKTRPDLATAKRIVAGGRALQSAENFKMLEQLSDILGAALGATRAAVDAGYAPNDWQIGQTGKMVAPELYIAVGISGAIQHVAGIKDSKVIVAINKNPDAPIFQIADYGLVGDLFEIIPQLIEALRTALPKG